ncbi:hypothetical protein D9615_006771 [Tricholomella constricta]|uniref:Uncharacterized protein n=1 Tax=Tricholomella constricta TaxID=117010 RepID=A0A8H5H763_9AGAR|nr:hypothetical protein D9615_006771 [Tricholomella constricta]
MCQDTTIPEPTSKPHHSPDLQHPPPRSPNTNTNSNTTLPTSFETDPDPSKTPACTRPYTPGGQYALMIDAGSTGSRIHIYKFNSCGFPPSYEWGVFNQTSRGLRPRPARRRSQPRRSDGRGRARRARAA